MPIFKGPKASGILSDGGKREGIGFLGLIKGSKPKARKKRKQKKEAEKERLGGERWRSKAGYWNRANSHLSAEQPVSKDISICPN